MKAIVTITDETGSIEEQTLNLQSMTINTQPVFGKICGVQVTENNSGGMTTTVLVDGLGVIDVEYLLQNRLEAVAQINHLANEIVGLDLPYTPGDESAVECAIRLLRDSYKKTTLESPEPDKLFFGEIPSCTGCMHAAIAGQKCIYSEWSPLEKTYVPGARCNEAQG